MKKTLLFIVILTSLCLLCACNLGGGGATPTAATTAPRGSITTASATTTAPHGESTTPSLSELSTALQTAAPLRIRLSLHSHHAGMGEGLTTDAYILLGTDEGYYYYESEYFLPLADALAEGKTVGIRTGHLLMNGSTISSSSDEIDGELLADLREYSIRKPTLRADLFAEYAITREGELVILTARAAEGMSGVIYDPRLEGARELSLRITFREGAALLPISYHLQMTAANGTPLSYEAAYSYTPAPMPTGEAVLSPDLTIWE